MTLRRWWTRKYHLPWSHPLAQQSTLFELEVEFWEDLFEEHPDEMLDVWKDADGNIAVPSIGDKLVDRWLNQMARGIDPDLEEGYSQEQRAANERDRARRRRAREIEGELAADLPVLGRGGADQERLLDRDLLGNER